MRGAHVGMKMDECIAISIVKLDERCHLGEWKIGCVLAMVHVTVPRRFAILSEYCRHFLKPLYLSIYCTRRLAIAIASQRPEACDRDRDDRHGPPGRAGRRADSRAAAMKRLHFTKLHFTESSVYAYELYRRTHSCARHKLHAY